MKVQLTMLNSMADSDVAAAVRKHRQWNLRWLDLKDSIYGKLVADLSDEEARRVRALADGAGLGVYCMSTVLFSGHIEDGEAAFRRSHLEPVKRAVELAGILRPARIRLLAAQTRLRGTLPDSTQYILREQPWLLDAYRQAVDWIAQAGVEAVIENEIADTIWARPQEITSFFGALQRPKARLVWDIQNLWQMGTFPTLEVYRQLRPLIGMVHLKGGMADQPGGPLRWRSSLADASWPVIPILKAVIADGLSPVICLNLSHGKAKAGYDYTDVVGRDIQFLRRTIPEIE